MRVGDAERRTMTLLAYEQLTDHGLALPLFGTSNAANALHVAVPTKTGDPAALINDFEVYPATTAVTLDTSLHRAASVGTVWIDVFVWDGVVHVGTRAELWASTKSEHETMQRTAPLTLLSLAEGVDRGQAARCAALVYEWLARDWGVESADHWRLDSYFYRLARRDLARHFDEPSTVRSILQTAFFKQHQAVLELRSPRVAEFGAGDLPDLAFAADALGWCLEVVFDPYQSAAVSVESEAARVMVMRLRHGRGQTQTQIPLRVFDGFFGGERNLRDARTGRARKMTLSTKANGIRNTMKLQLPEIAKMLDPVARFERTSDGFMFELHDAKSLEGRLIANLLNDGLLDRSTRKTQGGATWWRILP